MSLPSPHLRRGLSAFDVYNASMNGIFLVDARPVAEVDETGRPAGAEGVAERPWELPDDPRRAVVLVREGDSAALALALERLAEYSSVVDIGICDAPFAVFAARFPFAVYGGPGPSASVPGMPCMPAAISDGVWLGAAMHAERPAVLVALGVRRVVCVMDDPGGCIPGGAVPVQRWPWVDSPRCDISGDLDAVAAAIEEGRREGGGGVLVHCFQGKSRSAAAVLAWMIATARGADRGGEEEAHAGVVVDTLHAQLQRHRAIVQVNDGFLAQLKMWAGARRHGGGAAAVATET